MSVIIGLTPAFLTGYIGSVLFSTAIGSLSIFSFKIIDLSLYTMQNLFYLTLAYFMGMSSSKSTSVTTWERLTGIVRLWFSRALGHVNVIKFTIRTDIFRKSLREFVRFEEVVCFCDCFQKHFPNLAVVYNIELHWNVVGQVTLTVKKGGSLGWTSSLISLLIVSNHSCGKVFDLSGGSSA